MGFYRTAERIIFVNMRYLSLFLWLGALGLLFGSCRKKTETSWDVDVIAPIINADLNMGNFLEDNLFNSDNTGLLHLNINRNIASLKLDTLIAIPDTIITSGYTWTLFPVSIGPGQILASGVQQPLTFNFPNGIGLRYVNMEKGQLKVEFKNSYSQPIDFKYSFPGITKNGVMLEVNETLAGYDTTGRVRYYDLGGYQLNMTGNGGQINTLSQNYSVKVSPGAQTATIQTGQGVTLKISYKDLIPQYVEGYFGKQTITLKPDSAKLDIAKNFTASNFKLNSATVEFKVINDFGCELSAGLGNIVSVNKVQNTQLPLNAQGLSNININRANKTGLWYSPYSPSIKQIILNNTNSNVKQCLELLPDYLKYSGSIDVNPLGNTSGFNDFAYLNSAIRIDANIDIPMVFNADHFDLTALSTVNLSQVKQINNINHGRFIIKTVNGFPFSARLQAYMLDSLNTTIDSVFTAANNTIAPGIVNAQNTVVASTGSELSIPVEFNRIGNLKKTRKIKIVARLVMPPNPPDIKLLETYRLSMKIIVDVNYNVRP